MGRLYDHLAFGLDSGHEKTSRFLDDRRNGSSGMGRLYDELPEALDVRSVSASILFD